MIISDQVLKTTTYGINEETGQNSVPLSSLRFLFIVYGSIDLLEVTYLEMRLTCRRNASDAPATKEKLLPWGRDEGMMSGTAIGRSIAVLFGKLENECTYG